ncbi:MAG: hypothetical protein HYV75_11590 [Opitutae bacterium]|nr:hypothetical protein [Opitutae bacterium]
MLIATTAAAGEYNAAGRVNGTVVHNKTFADRMRSYTVLRRRVHITGDNSAKT